MHGRNTGSRSLALLVFCFWTVAANSQRLQGDAYLYWDDDAVQRDRIVPSQDGANVLVLVVADHAGAVREIRDRYPRSGVYAMGDPARLSYPVPLDATWGCISQDGRCVAVITHWPWLRRSEHGQERRGCPRPDERLIFLRDGTVAAEYSSEEMVFGPTDRVPLVPSSLDVFHAQYHERLDRLFLQVGLGTAAFSLVDGQSAGGKDPVPLAPLRGSLAELDWRDRAYLTPWLMGEVILVPEQSVARDPALRMTTRQSTWLQLPPEARAFPLGKDHPYMLYLPCTDAWNMFGISRTDHGGWDVGFISNGVVEASATGAGLAEKFAEYGFIPDDPRPSTFSYSPDRWVICISDESGKQLCLDRDLTPEWPEAAPWMFLPVGQFLPGSAKDKKATGGSPGGGESGTAAVLILMAAVMALGAGAARAASGR